MARNHDDQRTTAAGPSGAVVDPGLARDAVIAAVKQLTDAAASRADASLGPAAH